MCKKQSEERKMSEFSLESLEHLEAKIIDKANFNNICIHHGTKDFKDCIREAVNEVVGLETDNFFSMFGCYKEDYVNYLYSKVEVR